MAAKMIDAFTNEAVVPIIIHALRIRVCDVLTPGPYRSGAGRVGDSATRYNGGMADSRSGKNYRTGEAVYKSIAHLIQLQDASACAIWTNDSVH
jgi:hypothetical protein